MTYVIDKTRHEYIYAQKILSGEYLACELEKLACKRFLRDLERQNDPEFPWCYDWTRADRFFRFFEKCPDVEAPEGTLLKLAEFQYFDFGNLFGWVEKTTGCRRWREALIYEARGQGKSSACAVIALYVLTADKIYLPFASPSSGYFEPNQKITLMAYDKDQTAEVREPIIEMVNRSKDLNNEVDTGKGDATKTYIRGRRRGGNIRAISKDTKKLDGAKLNLIICDEFAAHTEEQRLATLMGSFGKRRQSMCVKITTAGDDAAHKPAKSDYDRCVEILHNRIEDDVKFVIIRELEENDNPADFSLYEKSTPMFREKTEYAERLMAAVKAEYNAAFNGGSEQAKIEYLIKRTNRWQVGSQKKAFTQEQLDMLAKSQIPQNEFFDLINGHATVVGIDASKKIDLTADAFVFKLPDDKIGIYAHGFMPSESRYAHGKTDKLPYDSYAERGYMTYIEGTYIDIDYLEQHFCDFEDRHDLNIKIVSADPAYCHQLLIDCADGKTPNHKAYDVENAPQTTKLNEACENFINWLVAGRLVICENALFMKHCANAYVEYDKGGRMKFAKKNKDSYDRIDLLAAVIDAILRIDVLDGEDIINALTSGVFSF